MTKKAVKKSKKEEVIVISTKDKIISFFKHMYNSGVQLLGVLLDNLSFLMGKLFKPMLYALEGVGVYYVLYMLTKFSVWLAMIQAGQTEAGKAYIDALIAVATASNTIVLGMAVALPTFMGAMKIAKRKLIP